MAENAELEIQNRMDRVSNACDDIVLTKTTEAIYQPTLEKPYSEPNIFVYGAKLHVIE